MGYKFKDFMKILQLERIALGSHKGSPKNTKFQASDLQGYEKGMGFKVSKQIAKIRQSYPTEKLFAVDIGCFSGTAAAGLNSIEGIYGFGIDIRWKGYNSHSGLPTNRFIAADAQAMPEIPDETFHYILSYNTLSYTDPIRSFPEIFRILKPGGKADLDLENWTKHINELLELDMIENISLAGVFSGFKGTFQQYFEHLRHLKDTDRRNKYFNYNRDVLFVRFEIEKPKLGKSK
jgi:SAM-dependent methyltransferase